MPHSDKPPNLDQVPHPALPRTARLEADGVLSLGGVPVPDLVRRFGTPLYVYDVETLRASATTLVESLGDRGRAHYAGKAYLAPWLLRYLLEWGMDLDACSATELAIALGAGFPAARIRLHGNNKGDDALRLAIQHRIGAVVVDNLEELRRLIALGQGSSAATAILLRLNPGIKAHTHEYLRTGVASSKFGLPIADGTAAAASSMALEHPAVVRLLGYHAHIGTQILDLEPYGELMASLLDFAGEMQEAHGYWPEQLSPGGGPGITYTDEQAMPLGEWVQALVAALGKVSGERIPAVHIEPGRSIVGPAGVAIYTVGGTKRMGGGRTYVLIDGGMADNIRPALYQAVYTALPATRMGQQPRHLVSIAGPYCESGDILIEEVPLPDLVPGDLLAVPAAGAYCLPMSSNYNGALRPAVVTVDRGVARLVQRRQTVVDLLALDSE